MRIKDHIPKRPKPKEQQKPSLHPPTTANTNKIQWMVSITLLLSLIAFLPVLKAGFFNLDDPGYVLDNLMIRNLSNIREMFMTPVLGNYHPLTMISLAINYAVSGLNPFSYHLFNLLLHLLNVSLVFLFVYRLSSGKPWIAFITALLFGIHPMHVESVVWVTERKDMLYTAFFLAGLISYVAYVKGGKMKYLLFTFLWLILSLMSKPAAIIFPLVLFTIDFYLRRKFSARLILEKLPLIILSAAFVWLTLNAQNAAGAMDIKEVYPPDRRFFFGTYGFIIYIIKFILPVNLSPFYPFPPVNVPLPLFYYISPLFVVLIALAVLLSLRKTRVVAFGILFYGLNVLLVLQFYVIGSAVISDRYSYLSYIGLFFILAYGIQYLLDHNKGTGQIILGVFAILAMVFIGMTYSYASKWKDNITLWEDAVKHNPGSRAYEMLGLEYKKKGDADKAVDCFTKAIAGNKIDAKSMLHRGFIYLNREQWDLAFADFNSCLEIEPNMYEALVNRAVIYSRRGTYDKALLDFEKAEKIKPDFDQIYSNRSLTYLLMGKFQESLRDCEHYLQYKPDNADVINSMGVCYSKLGNYSKALDAFDRALKIKENPTFRANRESAARKLIK